MRVTDWSPEPGTDAAAIADTVREEGAARRAARSAHPAYVAVEWTDSDGTERTGRVTRQLKTVADVAWGAHLSIERVKLNDKTLRFVTLDEAHAEALEMDAARGQLQFCRKGLHTCTPAVTLTFDGGVRRLHWCAGHADDADQYRASSDQTDGPPRVEMPQETDPLAGRTDSEMSLVEIMARNRAEAAAAHPRCDIARMATKEAPHSGPVRPYRSNNTAARWMICDGHAPAAAARLLKFGGISAVNVDADHAEAHAENGHREQAAQPLAHDAWGKVGAGYATPVADAYKAGHYLKALRIARNIIARQNAECGPDCEPFAHYGCAIAAQTAATERAARRVAVYGLTGPLCAAEHFAGPHAFVDDPERIAGEPDWPEGYELCRRMKFDPAHDVGAAGSLDRMPARTADADWSPRPDGCATFGEHLAHLRIAYNAPTVPPVPDSVYDHDAWAEYIGALPMPTPAEISRTATEFDPAARGRAHGVAAAIDRRLTREQRVAAHSPGSVGAGKATDPYLCLRADGPHCLHMQAVSAACRETAESEDVRVTVTRAGVSARVFEFGGSWMVRCDAADECPTDIESGDTWSEVGPAVEAAVAHIEAH